jgi:hypothetical protein
VEPISVVSSKASIPNAAFTPGPWLIQKDGNDEYSVWARQPFTHQLATVLADDDDIPTDVAANARLIEAATDLFDALRPFAAAYEDEGDGAAFEDQHNLWEHGAALDLTVGDLRRARTALAKARGEVM